jgi:colanic acid/amylovoran biosynthesis glycosyltransferase
MAYWKVLLRPKAFLHNCVKTYTLPAVRIAPKNGYPGGFSYTETTLLRRSHPSPTATGAENLRIAYLLSRYPAISHTFFLKEVQGLRERGLDIHVASINPPDRPLKSLPETEAIEAGKTYYVKPAGLSRIAFQVLRIALLNPGATLRGLYAALSLGEWDLKARFYTLFYLAEALLAGNWMRRESLNHLHVHFGGPVATVGLLTAKTWQIPWSMTLHGPDEFFDQDAFYLRQKIESASFIICISDFCRSQVLRIAPGLDDARLEVLRLGVDCHALHPPEPSSVSNSAPFPLRLVCTGRMVAAKGHRILLEALASLLDQGIGFSCALIGGGPERDSLEFLCKRLGIAEHVRFLGAMAHQPALTEVEQAHVFVLASFAEGLPVSLMEAMALGIPCISTTIAAIPELIQNSENGLLVPPANPEALCNALIRLANDTEFRHRLGLNARAAVEDRYDLASNLDLLAEMWSRRLSGNP